MVRAARRPSNGLNDLGRGRGVLPRGRRRLAFAPSTRLMRAWGLLTCPSAPRSTAGGRQEESMRTRLSLLAVLALASLAASPAAGASAVVIVAEDGGFPPDTVKTVRSLAVAELRTRGIDVGDEPDRGPRVRAAARPPRPEGAHHPGGPRAAGTTPDFTATHAASSIDEADVVVPRLVRAVLTASRSTRAHGCRRSRPRSRRPSAAGPARASSSSASASPRSGGRSGGATRPARWRLGILAQGADDGASFFGVEGAGSRSTPASRPTSARGSARWAANSTPSLGTKLEVGVEFFRLHGVRLMAGVSAIIPFESRPGEDRVSWGLSLRCGF